MDEPVIRARDLRMRYGRAEVLRGVDLDVRAGEVVALLGPNGAGKTTTIEILEGFRRRSAGDVAVLGGVPAYLVGRAVTVLCRLVTCIVLMLVAGMAFAGVSLPSDPGAWLTLLWVLALGTLAVVPIGAALGTLLPGPRNAASILSLVLMRALRAMRWDVP